MEVVGDCINLHNIEYTGEYVSISDIIRNARCSRGSASLLSTNACTSVIF